MKYCYNCNRVTVGDPSFCNFCGRSYNVKLCPRMHANPRNAETCSQCGSRDFSTPQPRVPWWAPILEFVLSLVPALVLIVLSIGAIAVFTTALLHHPEMLNAVIPLLIALGVLWWLWSLIPEWFRAAIHRLLKRQRDPNGRRKER